MDAWTFFFGFRGRINRAKYWLALLSFVIADVALLLLGAAVGNGTAFHVFSYPVSLAIFVSSLAVGVRRVHDRDRSAWWLFLFYIAPGLFALPSLALIWAAMGSFGDARVLSLLVLRLCLVGAFALAIWGVVELGFLRSTTGYNRFGADPLAKTLRSLVEPAAQLGHLSQLRMPR
jgi:uncharacterized membrane protein YhaH (DUF805 family)